MFESDKLMTDLLTWNETFVDKFVHAIEVKVKEICEVFEKVFLLYLNKFMIKLNNINGTWNK